MSHEILLICGREESRVRARRLARIRHAAERVPGMASYEVVDAATAACALVQTDPTGGSFAELIRGIDSTARISVATTTAGLAAAASEPYKGHLLGAEAGHVNVKILADGNVVVGTDGMAFLPSYWAQYDEELYFSTHLASMVSLGLPADPDERGILEYLVMLHPLEDRTLLGRAQLMSPGTLIEWHGNGPRRLNSQPLFVPSDHSFTDDEAVGTFASVWQEIIGDVLDRNSSVRLALGLSGGLDSRAIAAMMVKLHERPLSYTYGTAHNREVRVASMVAQRLGLPHLRVPVTDDRMLRNSFAIAQTLDGAHSPAEMYELWFDDLLPLFSDVILNGLAGGPLWGDDKALGLTNTEEVLDRQWARYAATVGFVRPFLEDSIAADAEAEIRGALRSSIERWDFSQRGDVAIFWKLANRQLRWGNMLVNGLRRAGLGIEAPFLDSRFLRFASSLTTDQRRNGSLYLRAHREVLASTANIGRSDDGNSPRHLDHVYWSGDSSLLHQLSVLGLRHPVSAGRRAARQVATIGAATLRRRIGINGPSNIIDERSSAFPAELWLRTRPTYRDRLADSLEAVAPHPLLSESAIDHAAKALRQNQPTAPALILARIATTGLWLADYTTRARELSRGLDD